MFCSNPAYQLVCGCLVPVYLLYSTSKGPEHFFKLHAVQFPSNLKNGAEKDSEALRLGRSGKSAGQLRACPPSPDLTRPVPTSLGPISISSGSLESTGSDICLRSHRHSSRAQMTPSWVCRTSQHRALRQRPRPQRPGCKPRTAPSHCHRRCLCKPVRWKPCKAAPAKPAHLGPFKRGLGGPAAAERWTLGTLTPSCSRKRLRALGLRDWHREMAGQ